MNLKVLLPSGIFTERADVSRIVAESREGSFGLLPKRLDCVAALVPGILTYQCSTGSETYIGLDEGVLVKTGDDVFVAVRRAIAGNDLGQLRKALDQQFLALDDNERDARSVMAKLETGIVRRLVRLADE